MEQNFNEKLTPSRCMWCVLNNLQKFDEKPEFVLNLVEKWKEQTQVSRQTSVGYLKRTTCNVMALIFR